MKIIERKNIFFIFSFETHFICINLTVESKWILFLVEFVDWVVRVGIFSDARMKLYVFHIFAHSNIVCIYTFIYIYIFLSKRKSKVSDRSELIGLIVCKRRSPWRAISFTHTLVNIIRSRVKFRVRIFLNLGMILKRRRRDRKIRAWKISRIGSLVDV